MYLFTNFLILFWKEYFKYLYENDMLRSMHEINAKRLNPVLNMGLTTETFYAKDL
jgi:hypothetical protein